MTSLETCWTLIRAVSSGDRVARDDFVRHYHAPVRGYLMARWRNGPLASECEDAVQEVFVRCFSKSGPLDRVGAVSEGGFRGFLYGICRNVAREQEQSRGRRRAENGSVVDEVTGRETRLSDVFDRAFARQVMKEARDRFEKKSMVGDRAAQKRFELLGLRFEEGLPIRAIAQRWNQDAAKLHKEYSRARREYREALLEVVAEQDPGRTDTQVEDAAKHLIELLG